MLFSILIENTKAHDDNNIYLVKKIDLVSILRKYRVRWINITDAQGYEMDILEGTYKPFVCIKQKSLLKFGHGMSKKIKTVARSFGYSTVEPIYSQYLLQKPRRDSK